ncbi:hypothetical protein [Pimelobacter simplex]|uniref:hypothetical protein n=1 Tax=Nocardioides simplex TaxID=2045 RepID=UPI003AB0C373
MQALRADWTPTAAESKAYARAVALIGVRTFAALILVGGVIVAAAVAPLLDIDFVALLAVYVVLQVVVIGRQWRRIVKQVAADFPPGLPAAAEASEAGLRIMHPHAVCEYPWSRLSAPRVAPAYVSCKDQVTRGRFLFPRQLFPDAWLGLVGGGDRDDTA